MIKSKRELKKFVKEEIYKATGVKVNVANIGLYKSGNGHNYFSFEINNPLLAYLSNNELKIYVLHKEYRFLANDAKEGYFTEGFILNKEDILKQLQDTIIEIKEVLSER